MILGQRMVRLSDGVKGVVQQNGPELRIFWVDRGEELMAAKSEKWEPEEMKLGLMHAEEILLVAYHADRALKAYERHEPLKHWEKLDVYVEPYDRGLVNAIIEYLDKRAAQPAA